MHTFDESYFDAGLDRRGTRCEKRDGTEAVPYGVGSVRTFFCTLLVSILWRPLRHFVPLPLERAAFRGKDSPLTPLLGSEAAAR